MEHQRILLAGPVEPGPLLSGDCHQPVAQLSYGLIDLGFRVVTVTLSPEVTRVTTERGAGLEVILVPCRKTDHLRLRSLYHFERQGLESVIRSEPAEVVNAHWAYEYALAATRVASDRTVVTLHDNPRELLQLNPSAGLLARYLMARRLRTRRVGYIAVSPQVATTWRRIVPGSDVRVIPNAADPVWSGTPNSDGQLRILAIGHAHPNKNIVNALTVWRRLNGMGIQSELHLVGAGLETDGPFDNTNACSRQGVFMHGPQPHDDVLNLMRKSTILVIPSLSEGCPLVVLEALSNGLPVCFDVAAKAVEWAVGTGGLGLDLANDPEQSAFILAQTMRSPSFIQILQTAAKRESSRFSRHKVAQATVERFKELSLL